MLLTLNGVSSSSIFLGSEGGSDVSSVAGSLSAGSGKSF
jgi:hypothetical protein